MELPDRDGLEEYAQSLDLSLAEVLELLESALAPEALPVPQD
jgi:hypothetical protein